MPSLLGRHFGKILILLVIVIIAGSSLWTWLSLSWAYSEGERAGTLQKFSKKGWVCKTYEGELALYVVSGVAPQIWYFSVRDEDVAGKLMKEVGSKVQVHYTEHKGIPTGCFGDTPYFAESYSVLKDEGR